MNPKKLANDIKVENVIDMAFTFTQMGRVFEAGSKERIVEMLKNGFTKLNAITTEHEYKKFHEKLCQRLVKGINTARKRMKNGKIKQSKNASYGQAAKVLDVAIKVYVHYCSYPSQKCARNISQYLYGAVDTPILRYLKRKYPISAITAKSIEGVSKTEYDKLQGLIRKDIKERFSDAIMAVQYDDIIWNELNRQ